MDNLGQIKKACEKVFIENKCKIRTKRIIPTAMGQSRHKKCTVTVKISKITLFSSQVVFFFFCVMHFFLQVCFALYVFSNEIAEQPCSTVLKEYNFLWATSVPHGR